MGLDDLTARAAEKRAKAEQEALEAIRNVVTKRLEAVYKQGSSPDEDDPNIIYVVSGEGHIVKVTVELRL